MPVPRWTRWLTAPFLTGILVTISAPPGLCYWSREGTLVETSPGSANYSHAVSDGHGGLVLVWRSSGLFTQRVDSLGVPLWDPRGVPITASLVNPFYHDVIPDDAGGCFAAFIISGRDSIYAQHVSPAGVRLWSLAGALVRPDSGASSGATSRSGVRIVSDGVGGIFVAWTEVIASDEDVRLLRLDANGAIVPGWPSTGVRVATGPLSQTLDAMAVDGTGGAYLLWNVDAGDPYRDLRIHRVLPNGSFAPGWPSFGLPLIEGGPWPDAFNADLVNVDGDAVALAFRRVDSKGSLVLQRVSPGAFYVWGSGGVEYVSVSALESYPEDLEPDGLGGVFASFRWSPPSIPIGLSVLRISSFGEFQWGPDGVEVGLGPAERNNSRLKADGEGGLFTLFTDLNQGRSDLRVQHWNISGTASWPAAGVLVGQAEAFGVLGSALVTAPSSGVFAGWTTAVPSGFTSDIRAQRILSTGEPGYALFAAPSSLAAFDVPADEGGWVRLTLGAAPADRPDWDPYVTGYNVWRRIAPTPTAAVRDVHELIARSQREVVQLSASEAIAAGFPPGSWESLGFHGADGRVTYELVASTRTDSSAEGTATEEYVVASHLSVPGVVRVSEVVSTHSVDNLAPAPPSLFSGVYGSGNTLSWGPNHEGDLVGYRLYRGDHHDFPMDEAHRIYAGTATQFVDAGGGETDFYKLTATDRHGNEGRPSLVLPPGVAGVEPVAAALSLAVLGEMPSRRGTVDLEIRQRGNEAMTLEVLDLSGRCVERQSFVTAGGTTRCTIGGRASLRSGVYFVRVHSHAETALRRILITR